MYNEDNGLNLEAAPFERVFDPPSQKEAMYQKLAEEMEPLNFDDAREVCLPLFLVVVNSCFFLRLTQLR